MEKNTFTFIAAKTLSVPPPAPNQPDRSISFKAGEVIEVAVDTNGAIYTTMEKKAPQEGMAGQVWVSVDKSLGTLTILNKILPQTNIDTSMPNIGTPSTAKTATKPFLGLTKKQLIIGGIVVIGAIAVAMNWAKVKTFLK